MYFWNYLVMLPLSGARGVSASAFSMGVPCCLLSFRLLFASVLFVFPPPRSPPVVVVVCATFCYKTLGIAVVLVFLGGKVLSEPSANIDGCEKPYVSRGE